MPTYEYACRDCGGHFEYFQSMREAPMATCEKCGGSLTKLLSAGTGLIFKGSGFYITDYKSGGSGEKKSEGGESKSESKEAPKSPSAKPDSAPPAKKSD